MKKTYISLWLSLSIVLSLFLFKPIHIILGNPTVFNSSFNSLLGYYVVGMIPYWLVLFSISIIVMRFNKASRTWVAILFAFSLLFFIQSNIIAWNYGILNGQSIAWNNFWYRELADLFIWITVLSTAIVKRELIFKNITVLAPAIIAIQFIPLLPSLINLDNNNRSNREYSIDQTKKFIFSKNKNIFVFVLDGVSNSSVNKILKENPELETELDGFVKFDNMLGTGGYTYFSVPAYFTGKPYLNKTEFNNYSNNAFNSENSLLKQLRSKNWNTGFYKPGVLKRDSITPELLTEIINKEDGSNSIEDPDLKALSLYLATPQSLKRHLYNLFDLDLIWENKSNSASFESNRKTLDLNIEPFPESSNDLIFMNKMLEFSSLSYTKPAFKYFHLSGAHSPFLVDRNLNKNKSSYNDVVYVSLKMAVRFIRILKELNIYDSSQIYVMTDHGYYGITSDIDRAKTYIPSYTKQAAAMFMFKDFSSRGKLIDNRQSLSFFDFPSIVMSLLNKEAEVTIDKALDDLEKDKRIFYTFSNARGKYYPKIIEYTVDGNIKQAQSWSLTGRSFLPISVKDKREFHCNADNLSLNNKDEFIHYIYNGVLNESGMTRSKKIIFKLPLSDSCTNEDVLISLKAGAVLGIDKRSGKNVNKRYFKIKSGVYTTQILSLNSSDYSDIKIMFPSELVKDQTLEFSLHLLNVIPGGYFVNTAGKQINSSSLALKSLEFNKPTIDDNYYKLTNESIDKNNHYNQRLSDISEVGAALGNYHKVNRKFPLSEGWDGICTKLGKSSRKYIYGLAPLYIDALPIDPVKNRVCGKGYLYKSNGKDFKFITNGAPNSDLQKVNKSLVDPVRKDNAYGIWSDGAKQW